MDDWRGFVQTFFDALHWAWMDGKLDRLAPFFTQESWKGKTDWQPVVSKLLDEREPEANIYAVSGRVIPICWLERERDIQASFLWRGWCHSRIGETRKVGETKRWLTIHLAKNGESWTIQEIYEWRQGRQGKEPEPGTGQGEGSEPEPGSIQVNGEHPPATESRLPVPEPCAGVEDAEEIQAKPVLNVYGASGYNPGQAVAYAEHYWNSSNPAYPLFQDDCTNFISQCLRAGGIPMLFSKDKTRGWWMRTGKDAVWSYSWSVAHSLYLLLKSGAPPMRAEQKNGPEELVPGDVICYDFDGDGRFQHNTIVVAKDASNMPLVNAHSSNSRMRFWAYLDSTAYTPNIRYAFFHIRGL